jgi:ribonucleoside-diphosphate reductase alpha chain
MTGNPDIPIATSILDYIFRWLRLHFDEEIAEHLAGPSTEREAQPPADTVAARAPSGLTCPDCGLQLDFMERCLVCRACGYTRCS